jgi:hypothetical protein
MTKSFAGFFSLGNGYKNATPGPPWKIFADSAKRSREEQFMKKSFENDRDVLKKQIVYGLYIGGMLEGL